MKIRIFLVAFLLLAMPSYSFAQGALNEKVKAYQTMIEKKNDVIVAKMMETADSVSPDYDGLADLINKTIQELRSMETIAEVKAHKDLYIKYLEAHLAQVQAMGNIKSTHDMDYLDQVNRSLEDAFNKLKQEERVLCGRFKLVCKE